MTFILQIFAYGINIGVFVAVSTLLNQFVLLYFPVRSFVKIVNMIFEYSIFQNSEEDVGRMGLIMVVLGMLGAIGFGYSLDKTHKYKYEQFMIQSCNLSIFLLPNSLMSKNALYLQHLNKHFSSFCVKLLN